MDKSVVQRVFEFVASQAREVTTREVLGAFPDSKSSAVTFSLSRLVKAGELARSSHGRYCVALKSGELDDRPILEDPFLMYILERVRPVLEFGELVYLYGALEVAKINLPTNLAKFAQERSKAIRDNDTGREG